MRIRNYSSEELSKLLNKDQLNDKYKYDTIGMEEHLLKIENELREYLKNERFSFKLSDEKDMTITTTTKN